MNRLYIYSCITIIIIWYTYTIHQHSFCLCDLCGLVGFVVIIIAFACVGSKKLLFFRKLFARQVEEQILCAIRFFCFRNIYFYCIIESYIVISYNVRYLLLYYLYKYLFANTHAQRTKRSYEFVHEHKHTRPTNIIMFICLCMYTAAAAYAYGPFSR